MNFDIFISYSSKDKTAADAACAVLEGAGVRCWIAPRDVIPGKEYGASIVEAIERAKAMLLIFSSNANESPQIRREIERAVKKGVTIIPLRIEDVEPTQSMEYFLGGIHWLDAMTPPLEQHLQRLAGTIRAMLAASGAQSTETSAAKRAEPAAAATQIPAAPRSETQAREARKRGWLKPTALGLSALALLLLGAGAAWIYMSGARDPLGLGALGAPQDGMTLSGPAEAILRYYPSPSHEACRADCERAGADCVGYSWVKPGGYQAGDAPMCYLDRWYTGFSAHPCCITATREGSAPRK